MKKKQDVETVAAVVSNCQPILREWSTLFEHDSIDGGGAEELNISSQSGNIVAHPQRADAC